MQIQKRRPRNGARLGREKRAAKRVFRFSFATFANQLENWSEEKLKWAKLFSISSSTSFDFQTEFEVVDLFYKFF